MGDGLIGGGTANFLELELSMATHPESIAVFLTDAQSKFTYPDGRSEDIAGNAGTVQHMDAFTHLPESTSKTAFEVMQVELKS